MQLGDDGIVVRVILKSAAGVDDAREAEAVQFAHELPRGVVLVLGRQLRPLGQRGVEDGGVGPRDQQAGGIAALVALDLAAGRIGRVLVVADGTQRGPVEHRLAIEVQDEDRRVGRRLVELLERGQALLGELELAPAADHAHPLRGRGAGGLLPQHAQTIRERRHAIPAELEVVVQPAADDMQVGIVETGDDGASAEIDDAGCRAAQRQDGAVRTDGQDAAVAEGHGFRERALFVLRGDATMMENEVGQ